MNIEDLAQLACDEPATLLWCGGERFAADALGARRDFGRLDDALKFIVSELPLGRRLTAWTITGNRLIPPEGNAALWESLAA
jgi:hypothetical protein